MPMNPRFFLLLVSCFCLVPGSAAEAEKARASSPPNVLMIAVDDLNDWIGAMRGHPQAKTPNLDRLAAEGTLFTNAHCQAPICGPSRASVFTGMLPSTTGNYLHVMDGDIRKGAPPVREAVFLQDYLERFGYRTVGVGKVFHQGDATGVHDVFGGHKSFGPYAPERFNYHPAWFDRPAITSTDWGAYPETDTEMPDHKVAGFAAERLAGNLPEPFFLAAGFNRPHVPWYVPEKWFRKFPVESIETPPWLPDDLADVPPMGRKVNEVDPTPTTEWALRAHEWKRIVRAYLACIAFVDHQIGRVLDALESGPYADNTLVVLWSDHGYHIGEKNRFAKMSLWRRSTRVPLIFRGPGIPAGKEVASPVNLMDMYPTFLDRLQLPSLPQLEGHSLVPFFRGTGDPWPHPAVTFHGRGNLSLYAGNFHYIQYADGSEELYDLTTDPNEWTNLAEGKAVKQVLRRFRAMVPAEQAPLSPHNHLDWNAYFREKTRQARD